MTELCGMADIARENENPYTLYPLELIRDANVPVLKRKSLCLMNRGFANALRAFRYIEEAGLYDTELIKRHLLRIGRIRAWGGLNYWGLDGFYASRSKIYFYGAGTCGKNMAEYFGYRGWVFENFLVTDTKDQPRGCIPFRETDIAETDGIIITVGSEELFMEIKGTIEGRYGVGRIYT